MERLRFKWMSYKDKQVGLTLSDLPMATFTLTNSSIHYCTARYFTGKMYSVSHDIRGIQSIYDTWGGVSKTLMSF